MMPPIDGKTGHRFSTLIDDIRKINQSHLFGSCMVKTSCIEDLIVVISLLANNIH